MDITVRPATLEDLPGITEIHNYYTLHTHITFDVQAYLPEQRVTWFKRGLQTGSVTQCDTLAARDI